MLRMKGCTGTIITRTKLIVSISFCPRFIICSSLSSFSFFENLETEEATKIITLQQYWRTCIIGIRFKKLDSIFNVCFQSWIQYHHVPDKVRLDRVQWSHLVYMEN